MLAARQGPAKDRLRPSKKPLGGARPAASTVARHRRGWDWPLLFYESAWAWFRKVVTVWSGELGRERAWSPPCGKLWTIRSRADRTEPCPFDWSISRWGSGSQ